MTTFLAWLVPAVFMREYFSPPVAIAAAVASVAISAYGAYNASENAQDSEDMQREAMDRADPFGQNRGEYTQGLRNAVGAGDNPGAYLGGYSGNNVAGGVRANMTPTGNPTMQADSGMNGMQPGTQSGPGGLQYYASGMPAPLDAPDYSGLQNLSSDITNNPAYQFRMQQGMENVGRQASAKGMLNSGNYLKDLTDYAQGLASTEYDREYQRQFGLTNQQFANATERQGQGFRNVTLAEQQAQDRFNRYALLTGAQNVMPGSAISAASQNAFGYNAAQADNIGGVGAGLYRAYNAYQANPPPQQPAPAVQNSGGGY